VGAGFIQGQRKRLAVHPAPICPAFAGPSCREPSTAAEAAQASGLIRVAQAAACRDRLNVPRGPCALPVLKEAWVDGVIDANTLIWGQGLADFIPLKNVRTLVPQIRTVEGAHVAEPVGQSP
jgi:hypothetical protein